VNQQVNRIETGVEHVTGKQIENHEHKRVTPWRLVRDAGSDRVMLPLYFGIPKGKEVANAANKNWPTKP